MSLTSFLAALFDHGAVQVPQPEPIAGDELVEAQAALGEFEKVYRLSLPNSPPDFDVDVACRTAEALYRVCQCFVYRDQDTKSIVAPAVARLPCATTPSHHYSADLVLRFLPDIWRLARDAAANDPLVSLLTELAGRWPLSTVGISGLHECSMDAIAGDRCLLQMYVDRVLQRRDRSRISDQRVRDAVLCAIGAHADLAPELAGAIRDSNPLSQQEVS
jgi:hypothetical protein